ncbi:MAG: hypothetical protein ACD_72C00229G0001 [uncultured bacterium]|nr:MAG: hypothetical protein ACD_72C00229G0001 [uncultured bacterium]
MYFGYLLGRISHPIKLFNNKLFLSILLLLVVEIFSSIFGARPNVSVFGLPYRYQGLVTQISYMLFTIIILFSGNVYLRYIKFGGIGVSILVMAEYLFFNSSRIVGVLGDSNFTGGYLALTMAYINNPILLSVITLAVFLTGSRSALLAVVVIILGKIYFKYKSLKITLFAVMVVLLPMILWFPKRELSHFDNRQSIWTKGVEAGLMKPFLGYGVENFEVAFNSVLKQNDFDLKNIRVDKAHSELLEIFVNSGLVGLFLYVVTIVLTLKYSWDNKPVFLSLIGFLVISNLNVVSINEYIFFYLAVGSAIKLNSPQRSLEHSMFI